jgi:hypothetical protein
MDPRGGMEPGIKTKYPVNNCMRTAKTKWQEILKEIIPES